MKFILLFVLLFSRVGFAQVNFQTDHQVALKTQTVFTAGASTLILAANSKRGYLLIQNLGATSIIVKFGSTIATTEGVSIPAGGNYEMYRVLKTSVYVKAASGTPTFLVLEGDEL